MEVKSMKAKMETNDPEPPFKKVKPEQEEPEDSGLKLNDLPELPFDLIFSYLSLRDLIEARAVSRKWCKMIDSFKVKSLFYSEIKQDHILEKSRLIRGAFAQNQISSSKFEPFFQTFGQSIFSNLKRLRLYDLRLNEEKPQAFETSLNSFGRLEELDFIRFNHSLGELPSYPVLQLNLPMLKSIQLDRLEAILQLTLNAPRLQNVKHFNLFPMKLNLVHGESVEKLVIGDLEMIAVENLKNLKYLCCAPDQKFDSTFLSPLNQLKEFHLDDRESVLKIFEQKQRYDRADLKIYLCGCLLNGPDDPVIKSLSSSYIEEEAFAYMAQNPSRISEIPLCSYLYWAVIESVPPESEMAILNRFTGLCAIIVDEQVHDIERFLNFLKRLDNIVSLEVTGEEDQQLFDRLPDYCAVQMLMIHNTPTDLGFLHRLKDLVELDVNEQVDAEFIRMVLEELQTVTLFQFGYNDRDVTIKIERRIDHQNRFHVWVGGNNKTVFDVAAAFEFILSNDPNSYSDLEQEE